MLDDIVELIYPYDDGIALMYFLFDNIYIMEITERLIKLEPQNTAVYLDRLFEHANNLKKYDGTAKDILSDDETLKSLIEKSKLLRHPRF